jgi:hypothetical protein
MSTINQLTIWVNAASTTTSQSDEAIAKLTKHWFNGEFQLTAA